MPRINRGLLDGGFYHVINRGNAKGDVFLKEQDYQSFCDLMKESKNEYQVKLYAYCLMPNHFHFVVSFPLVDQFSHWMQWLMTSHVRRYHKHYEGSGHVWQGRFKSFLIQEDEHLITVMRYVEANPLRARLVDSADLWNWSSCGERRGISGTALLDVPPILIPPGWLDWVNRSVGESEIESIRRSVRRQTPYGSKKWQGDIAMKLGLESTLRPLGRPRKGDRLHFRENQPVPFI